MKRRVNFSEYHKKWQFHTWKCVDWTDEAMLPIGGFGDIYVTRTAEENYDPSCWKSNFRHQPGLMVHGAILGISKGPLTIFNQDRKVRVVVYSTQVLSRIHQHIRQKNERQKGRKLL